MTDVHPALEAVARAICRSFTESEETWRDWLPEARAALVALADAGDEQVRPNVSWLRDIATEPVTVEDVLREHHTSFVVFNEKGIPIKCSCGESLHATGDHAAHVADMLREAGLTS